MIEIYQFALPIGKGYFTWVEVPFSHLGKFVVHLN
jgi:hypothetical protein